MSQKVLDVDYLGEVQATDRMSDDWRKILEARSSYESTLKGEQTGIRVGRGQKGQGPVM